MRTMNKPLALALTLSMLVGTATAQMTAETPSARLGLFGNVDLTLNTGGFSALPEVPSCCTEYGSSMEIGWLAGITYIKPFDTKWSMHLRLHYWQYGAAFSETETLPVVDVSGDPDQATLRYDLNGSFTQISIEPLAGYTVSPDLHLLGGLTAGYIFTATYDQKETLVTPTDATFNGTQTRERNVLSGDIPDARVLGLGLTFGASYDLPLNEDRTVFLSPEILFTVTPLSQVSGISWTAQHVRAGLALSFVPPEIEDTLTDQEFYEFTIGLTPPTKGAAGVRFVSNVSATGLNADGSTTALNEIVVEEFESRRVRPLLPYVFFEESSYTIPSRYYAVTDDQRDGFSMDNFYNLDAMVTYHHLLNIIGRRMTDDPSATITVTGHATPDERGGQDLAMQRATSIKSYLTNTWDIDDGRVSVEAKGLPARASNQDEADGVAENRRVEISASTPEILAPIASNDTIRQTTPEAIRFNPSIDPRVPIKDWRLFVARRGVIATSFRDGDPVPASLDWRLSNRPGILPRGTMELSYVLAVSDSNDRVVPSKTKRIPVREIRLDEKDNGSARVDRYSLILFDFDSDALTPAHKAMVDDVKQNITSNSTVDVIGYTDRTGSETYNQQLSERRAKAVASELGLPASAARGVGERLPLYDNSTPEGRFYSRTVEVIVETPTN